MEQLVSMELAVLSLGTNLGDRGANMAAMVEALTRVLVQPMRVSPLMETEPLGMEDGAAWFLNRIVAGHYDGEVARPMSIFCCLANLLSQILI